MHRLKTVSLTVLAALSIAALTLCAPGVASAGPAVAPSSVAPVTCKPAPGVSPGGDWTVLYHYKDGHAVDCGFHSQYDWMVAARDATTRGIDQSSGYTYILVLDNTNSMTVKANFCATGPRCGVTTELYYPGPSDKSWNLIYETSCNGDFKQVTGSETYIWRQFLEDVGKVHFHNLAYVQIIANLHNGNAVDYHPNCSV